MLKRGRTYYFGAFPPPYGGVTVKNAFIFEELASWIDVEKCEFRKVSTVGMVRKVLFSGDTDVFCLGFGNGRLQRCFLLLVRALRPRLLGRLVLVVMGGGFDRYVMQSERYTDACRRSKRIFVETFDMCGALEKAGFTNVRMLPNCRRRPEEVIDTHRRAEGERLGLVYFSLIAEIKGAGVVLDAARELPEVDFHFYGQIEDGYEDEFNSLVEKLPNVVYHGVFDSAKEDAPLELARYDGHLFPTRWPAEGVPGVIVESKIGGVPTITTDRCYNGELIEDGVDGFLVSGSDDAEVLVSELVRAIRRLDEDPMLLARMKSAAQASAERFYIDNYITELVWAAKPDVKDAFNGDHAQRGQ